jgi:hypothetical protein
MNRILGGAGMVGGLAYALAGARMLFFGFGEDHITHLGLCARQRWLPLMIALIYIATVVWSVSTGRPTIEYALTLAGVCFVLLGNAIRTSPVPA